MFRHASQAAAHGARCCRSVALKQEDDDDLAAGLVAVWAILSAAFAALTAIFAKIGVENVNSDYATLIRTVVSSWCSAAL